MDIFYKNQNGELVNVNEISAIYDSYRIKFKGCKDSLSCNGTDVKLLTELISNLGFLYELNPFKTVYTDEDIHNLKRQVQELHNQN